MLFNSIFNFFAFLVSLLGFKGIRVVAMLLAVVVFDIFRIRRALMLENLNIVFKDTLTHTKKIHIARASLVSFFSTALEFIASKYLLRKAKFNFINKHYLDEIHARNQGSYGMCIHMGNWEYLCHINAQNFSPVHVVVKSVGKGALAQWIENTRTRLGFSLIDRKGKTSAATQIFKAIDKNEIIGFIVDQKRPKGEALPFFGKLASTNNSLIKLYLRKKAPIFSATIKRKKPGEFEVTYFPEFIIEEDPNLSLQQMTTHNTKRMNEIVEKMILLNPSEYFWMHNRWSL